MLQEANAVIEVLPAEHVGTCVLDGAGGLFRGTAAHLRQAIEQGRLAYHAGSIRGAFPSLMPRSGEGGR